MFSAVLSKPVCSPGGCHGNSQTAADFAPASSGDCENREEVLRVRNLSVFFLLKLFGKNLQLCAFLRAANSAGGVFFFVFIFF